jgi:hypothetical protein
MSAFSRLLLFLATLLAFSSHTLASQCRTPSIVQQAKSVFDVVAKVKAPQNIIPLIVPDDIPLTTPTPYTVSGARGLLVVTQHSICSAIRKPFSGCTTVQLPHLEVQLSADAKPDAACLCAALRLRPRGSRPEPLCLPNSTRTAYGGADLECLHHAGGRTGLL